MDILGTKYFLAKSENRTPIHLYYRQGFPIGVRISFLRGGRHDPQEKAGLAHFYEHMILMGTKSFPTKDVLTEEIEKYGGSIQATTSKEQINVNLTVADVVDLNQISKIYKSIFSEPLFDQNSFEKEKEVILNEIKSRQQNSNLSIFDLFASICFQNSPLAWPVGGIEKSVESIKLEDIVNFHETVLSTPATLTVSGGCDINQALEIVENIELKIGSLPVSKTIKNRGGVVTVRKNLEQIVQILFGFKTAPIASSDFYNLTIVSEVIGSGRSSLLQKKLRYEAGLSYSAFSTMPSYADTGCFLIKTATARGSVQKALDIICNLIRELVDTGLSKERVEMTVNKLLKQKRIQLQTSDSWINLHHSVTDPRIEVDNCFNYISNLQKVNVDDINQTIKKFFTGDNWYLALTGDISKSDIKVSL